MSSHVRPDASSKAPATSVHDHDPDDEVERSRAGSRSVSSMDEAAPRGSGERLRITEIFYSIQGEADAAGWPTVFIRLTGCPLRCTYCDTPYSFYGGAWQDIETIVEQVKDHGVRHVCVTGGEPLAQKRCLILLARLCDEGYEVSLETSGALDVAAVDARVRKVVDFKTPASGEMARNHWANIESLHSHDQVKFVICDREDYLWAAQRTNEHRLHKRCQVLFSPSHGQVGARELAEWILADRLPVRLQVQLHKYLWGDERGR